MCVAERRTLQRDLTAVPGAVIPNTNLLITDRKEGKLVDCSALVAPSCYFLSALVCVDIYVI